jgi:predicted RNA binding protein YcfA (HicA-like mRNA interferase family)
LAVVLEQLGFVCQRSRGSHFAYRHPDGRKTTLPYHAGRTLSRPFISDILKQIDVAPEEYVRLLTLGK